MPKEDKSQPLDEFGEGIEKDIVDPDVRDLLAETEEQDYGRAELAEELREHTSVSPMLSGGDVDADWQRADVGEETVGGENPTPDQDRVDELGQALGVTFRDTEPLHDKPAQNDRERWDLDPRSDPDYQERVKREFRDPNKKQPGDEDTPENE